MPDVVDKYFKDFAGDIRDVGYYPMIRLHFFHRGKNGIFAGEKLLKKLANGIGEGVNFIFLHDGVPFQSGQTIGILEGPAEKVAVLETTVDGILTWCGVASGMRDCVVAAGGKPVLDMAARHYPPELAAGLSYSAYVGGADGSSVDNAIKEGLVPSTWKEIGSLPHAAAALWSTFKIGDGDSFNTSRDDALEYCINRGFNFDALYPSVKAAVIHHVNHPLDNVVVLVDYEGREADVIIQASELFKEDLYAVRLDTTGNRVPNMNLVSEYGVTISLVRETRKLLDSCRRAGHVKIIATSGFNAEKIAAFEKAGAPVDIYGTGSHVAFWPTKASLGEVRVGGKWVRTSKAALTHFVHPGFADYLEEPSAYPIL